MSEIAFINRSELSDLLRQAGIWSLDIKLSSTLYTPLSPAWIAGPLRDAWNGYLFQMGVEIPEAEDGDCDKFSLWLMAHATILHRRTEDRPYPHAALAIGMVWYTTDAGKDHAVNIAVIRTNGFNSVRFLESQPAAWGLKTLSTDELDSVNFVLI